VRQRTPERRRRGDRVALGEPDEREPGLGDRAHLVGLAEGVFGGRQVADAQADVADRVVPGSRELADVVALQLLAGPAGLLFGLGELAALGHDLRAVDPADAPEAGHRLPLAPARRGVGPLTRAAVVGELAAGADGPAVDPAGGPRGELAGDGRDRRLIHARETYRGIAERALREA